MSIIYSETNTFKEEDLQDLFLALEWSSGKYPEKLVIAMKNYETVFSAWDGDKLIGLISTMDDGIMTAYIHYLLVNPDYQGLGIGRKLVEMTKERYKDYLRIVLVALEGSLEFYKRCGFSIGEGKTTMFITSLWT